MKAIASLWECMDCIENYPQEQITKLNAFFEINFRTFATQIKWFVYEVTSIFVRIFCGHVLSKLHYQMNNFMLLDGQYNLYVPIC